jgi:UTP:GlnB (protein PII) uridylyltransferase
VLHKIVQCLTGNGIDIRRAHFSTRGDLATDVFFITGAESGTIADAALQKVRAEIMRALASPPSQ